MNKKLILTAMTVALTVGCAQATNITGVTGTNGVYNITPEHYSGTAAYRKYDNFVLDRGHVANLNFQDRENVTTNAFVNLVGSKVQINGLLNSVKGNNFYNGHAIFITPGGFVLGQNGVINVGRLSVATPTQSTYNSLIDGYGSTNFDYAANIGRKVSKLAQNSDSSLAAGNAEVTFNGKVFTRERVEATGSTLNVGGNIVNGLKYDSSNPGSPLTTEAAAETLFNSLVNTDGTVKAANSFATFNKDNRILLKSTDSTDVTGTITNGAGNVFLTNNGSNGMTINGKVASANLTRAFNTKGALLVNEGAELNSKTQTVVENKGTTLTVADGAKVASNKQTEILNLGTGAMTVSGQAKAAGAMSLKNFNSSSGMTVDGSVTNTAGPTAINNEKGALKVDATISNGGDLGIINTGSGLNITSNTTITNTGKLKIANTGKSGMTVAGEINNTGEQRIYNDAGRLVLNGTIENKNKKLYIASRTGSTGLEQSASSSIKNTGGNLVIRNQGTPESGAKGLDLKGTVSATDGILAVNNDHGDMYVSSNVTVNNGSMGIINREAGNNMDVTGGSITISGGKANIKNYGLGNMTVDSEITHNKRVNVIANNGSLTLGSQVHNNSGALGSKNVESGGFYATARQHTYSNGTKTAGGTGVTVTSEFVVDGSGEVLIKNISGANGLAYDGTINTSGYQAALVNKKGNMNVGGNITTSNGRIVVSNTAGANKLTVKDSAKMNSGTTGNLFDNGAADASISSKATLTNMERHGKLKTN